MSRTQARKQIQISDFEEAMKGIFSTSVGQSTLDESPMAYKSTTEILSLIEPTAHVVAMVRPKLNLRCRTNI